MLFRMLLNIFSNYSTKQPLGRWGYHWEIKTNHTGQKNKEIVKLIPKQNSERL
jgi:hypothetical protein